MSIVVDENIDSGEWPEEFSGAWAYVCQDLVTLDYLFCLYFDERNTEGEVLEFTQISHEFGLPDAYVSWRMNPELTEYMGECREIFVHPDHRRSGIGTKLCAWARSYAKNNQNVVFRAPSKMTPEAQYMFHHIAEIYNEEYTNPIDFPNTIPYGYWGGYLV